MKAIFVTLLLCVHVHLLAQEDSISMQAVDSVPIASIGSIDTLPEIRPTNKYGDLLNDDPQYTRKRPWPLVSARVLSANIFNWALAKYAYRFDWPSSGPKDWKR